MLITTKQVAEMAGVTPKTIDLWERKGLMPVAAMRVGRLGHRRWDDRTIRDWVEREFHPTSPAPSADAHASECAPPSNHS